MNIIQKAFRIQENEQEINIIFKKFGFLNKSIICFKCRAFMTIMSQNGFYLKYQCRRCKSYFSEISGTFFSNMKIPLQKFLMLMHFFLINKSPNETFNYFKLSYPNNHISLCTIKKYNSKFLLLVSKFVKKQMNDSLFSGECELDETLVYKKKHMIDLDDQEK